MQGEVIDATLMTTEEFIEHLMNKGRCEEERNICMDIKTSEIIIT